MDPSSPVVTDTIDSASLNLDESSARELTYWDGLAIVAGIQIGSGIFSTPAVVAASVGSTNVALVVWLVAGLLVWTGAASFIELGTRIPNNGGVQQYLKLCLGDTYGFLFAWTYVFVLKPTSTAMMSTVFAEYFCQLVELRDNDGEPRIVAVKAIGLIALGTMTAFNCAGAKMGTHIARVFLALKIFGLSSISLLGLVHAVMPSQNPTPMVVRAASPLSTEAISPAGDSTWYAFGGAADGMFAALFSYGGWEAIGFVAGEVRNPAQVLPRVLHHSMALVMVLFLMAIAAMYSVVPMNAMKSDAIAVTFGRLIFGESGVIFYGILVCISCLGTLNATIFAVGRLTEAASQQRYLPPFIGVRSTPRQHSFATPESRLLLGQQMASRPSASSTTHNVPVRAMLTNGMLGTILLLTGSFRGLLTFKGMVEYFGYLCAIIGLIRLQRGWHSDPTLTPGEFYHTPQILPIVFSVTSTVLVLRGGFQHPVQVLGIAAFFVFALLIRSSNWWQKVVSAPVAD